MPTERFYRLPEEKKMIIKDAAIKEFIKLPFEKVSINKIIQNAEISRGSFYTYFEDKRDILSFIFYDIKDKAQQCSFDSLKRNQGDLWVMMTDLLEYLILCSENNDLLQLSKHTMLFQENIGVFEVERKDGLHCRSDAAMNRNLYEHVDKSDLKVANIEEFLIVLDMGLANLIMTFAQYCHNHGNVEELRSMFQMKMELLRYGVSKN